MQLATVPRRRRHRLAAAAVALTALAAAGCGGTAAPPVAKEAPTRHYVTRPDLRPPTVDVLTPAHGTSPGFLFLAPKKDVAQAGPLILDDRGDVVWFDPLDTKGVTDFRVQTYRGRPVLTWWRGRSEKGVGHGHYVIADDRYRQIATVRAGNRLSGDIHEFLITRRDTALITVYHDVPYDLRPFGGPKDGTLKEGVVQEIDIATGRVLFEWHSARHVDPSDSFEPLPEDPHDPWDYFHVNSIEPDGPGRLLVSSRHTSAVYEIRKSDGKILWRLGGKESDFGIAPDARFAWQHDARRQPDGTITLFDNAASHPDQAPQSRVLRLRLDEQARTATLVHAYAHTPPLLSTSQGDGQFLPDGHVLVGWGSNPYVTEFDAAGDVLLDLTFGGGAKVDSYRAYRDVWTGRPARPPVAVARAVGIAGTTVYASWNGATRVARWRVLAGPGAGRLSPVATFARDGFETRMPVGSAARWFAVAALAADGSTLGRSPPVERG